MTTEANAAPATGTTPGAPPATPAATPAVAAPPASPETLEIVDPNAAKVDTGPTIIEYSATGDAGLDMALEFIGNLGIGPEDAAMVAASSGDFGPLGEKLKSLGDKAKGYERYLALGQKAHADKAAAAKAQTEKDTAAIHSVVGGAEQWKAIKEWAGKNAEPHEREAVNTALKAGGMAAKAMALYLNTLYSKAAGTVVTPAAVAAPGANGAPANLTPLNPAEYQKEIAKLSRTHGANIHKHPEYKQLAARRQAWRPSR